MQCPICGGDLQEGGLIIDGVAPGWVPMEQFAKKGLKRMASAYGPSARAISCWVRPGCRMPISVLSATRSWGYLM